MRILLILFIYYIIWIGVLIYAFRHAMDADHLDID